MNEGGRPRLLTPEVAQAIADGIREGLTYKLAAWSAGVSYNTLQRWRAKGEEDNEAGLDTDEARFWVATRKADADLAGELLKNVRKATTGGAQNEAQPAWQAQAWLLERRHDYIKVERQEVEATVKAKVTKLSDDELLALLAEAGGGPTD